MPCLWPSPERGSIIGRQRRILQVNRKPGGNQLGADPAPASAAHRCRRADRGRRSPRSHTAAAEIHAPRRASRIRTCRARRGRRPSPLRSRAHRACRSFASRAGAAGSRARALLEVALDDERRSAHAPVRACWQRGSSTRPPRQSTSSAFSSQSKALVWPTSLAAIRSRFLASSLARACCSTELGLGGKAHHEWPRRAGADLRQNVGGACELERQRLAASS